MCGVKFFYTSNPRFPLAPLAPLAGASASASASASLPSTTSPLSQSEPPVQLHITLLDSSFNPPTLAHLALASHHAPPSLRPYQAHILALSAKNVDKPGADSRSVQLRLEMMTHLAKEMVRRAGLKSGSEAEPGWANVGVLLLEEPTFVGKSTLVKNALEDRIKEMTGNEFGPRVIETQVKLTFVVGWDTLTRIFSIKYYPSLDAMRAALAHFFDGEGSTFSCARRGDVPAAEEDNYLATDELRPWVDKGVINVWSLEESVAGASSTEVRRRVKAGESLDELILGGVADVVAREMLYRD